MNARKLLTAAALAILLVCGSLSSFIGIRVPLNYYDEGLTLLNATRVMQGDIPYHDFWTLYAPGHFYALAALFRVVGTNVLAARVLDTLCRIALSLLVYLVGRRMTSRWAAVVPYALVTLWVGAIGFYSYPIFPALALCLSVLLGLFRYMDTGRRRWLALAGILAGMAAIVRLDFGAYAALGAAIGILVFHIGQAGADVPSIRTSDVDGSESGPAVRRGRGPGDRSGLWIPDAEERIRRGVVGPDPVSGNHVSRRARPAQARLDPRPCPVPLGAVRGLGALLPAAGRLRRVSGGDGPVSLEE